MSLKRYIKKIGRQVRRTAKEHGRLVAGAGLLLVPGVAPLVLRTAGTLGQGLLSFGRFITGPTTGLGMLGEKFASILPGLGGTAPGVPTPGPALPEPPAPGPSVQPEPVVPPDAAAIARPWGSPAPISPLAPPGISPVILIGAIIGAVLIMMILITRR